MKQAIALSFLVLSVFSGCATRGYNNDNDSETEAAKKPKKPQPKPAPENLCKEGQKIEYHGCFCKSPLGDHNGYCEYMGN